MSTPQDPWTPELEDRLLRLATGEVAPSDATADAWLAASPELRRRFERLTAIGEGLDRAAAERRELLAEATAPVPGEDESVQRARRHFEREAGADARPAVLPLVPLGLAALVLLSVGLWLSGLVPETRAVVVEPPLVLGEVLDLVAPLGEVDEYDEFRWEYALEDGQAFELTLWDEASGEELWTSHRLKRARWSPPPMLELPSRVRWEVRVLDEAGNTVTSSASELVSRR